ncbi:MAG: LamG domain-containing protein [Armatimonadetes bacterium]|nr:LamG domain-containing protein [Armatimonadota bacterium]
MGRLSTVILAGLLSLPGRAAAPAGVFAPDDGTLFLAHYETSLDADFARGDPGADGNAELEAGRGPFGGAAVVLRRGLLVSPDGVRLPFRALTYDVAGNLDPERGTLEFWFAANFAERTAGETVYLHYLFDCRRGSSDGVVVLITAAQSGARTLVFCEQQPDAKEAQTLGFDVSAWKPGEWHHVAVTWGNSRRALFVDGARAGQRDNAPPRLAINDEAFRLGSVRWNNHYADGRLAELRISKVARYGQ